jgi:hypothetical protein
MAKNTRLNSKENTKKESQPSKNIFESLGEYFNLETKIEALPKYYLYYTLWSLVLVFLYITAQHTTEKYVRKVDTLKDSIEVLRLEYVSKKASYMHETKKSEILQQVQAHGLTENTDRPVKIVLED